jgi:molybdenum cofactor cytidylyltransferase
MISAIVLAAGLSTRMGGRKMFLPWGKTSVIEQVVSTLKGARIPDIWLVTGSSDAEIKEILKERSVRFIYNQDYANGEMLISVQVGLRALGAETEAALIVLGDQPQIELKVVMKILNRFQTTGNPIIVPSYQMHRGHPWLLGKSCWKEVLALKPPLTMRDFLDVHKNRTDYLNVDTASILQDLDTPEDYLKFKP